MPQQHMMCMGMIRGSMEMGMMMTGVPSPAAILQASNVLALTDSRRGWKPYRRITGTIQFARTSSRQERTSRVTFTAAELILAKTVPTLVIGMISIGPSMLIARPFDVPLRGDPLTLAVLSAALLTSAIAKGVGLGVLWPQLLWMLGTGTVLFIASGILFQRRLA